MECLYRRLHHGAVETVEATRELRGLMEMHGTRRWAYYTLSEATPRQVQLPLPEAMSDEEKILAYAEQHGSINNAECRRLLNIKDYKKAGALLQKLRDAGKLRQVGTRRWTRYELP